MLQCSSNINGQQPGWIAGRMNAFLGFGVCSQYLSLFHLHSQGLSEEAAIEQLAAVRWAAMRDIVQQDASQAAAEATDLASISKNLHVQLLAGNTSQIAGQGALQELRLAMPGKYTRNQQTHTCHQPLEGNAEGLSPP